MRRIFLILVVMLGLIAPRTACGAEATSGGRAEPEDYRLLKEIIRAEFRRDTPHEWGEAISGVRTKLKTNEKVLAIGVDLCDLTTEGQDRKLLEALKAEQVPATLFVCGQWVQENRTALKEIAADPLFEIANQGVAGKACSVNGNTAPGVPGTANVGDLFDEIEWNARQIEAVTGTLPHYYHAGAGHYDEVAVRIVQALGYEAVGSGVRLPWEKKIDREEILGMLTDPGPGTIAILGGASPQSTFADGVIEAVRKLRARGYKFAKISDYPSE